MAYFVLSDDQREDAKFRAGDVIPAKTAACMVSKYLNKVEPDAVFKAGDGGINAAITFDWDFLKKFMKDGEDDAPEQIRMYFGVQVENTEDAKKGGLTVVVVGVKQGKELGIDLEKILIKGEGGEAGEHGTQTRSRPNGPSATSAPAKLLEAARTIGICEEP